MLDRSEEAPKKTQKQHRFEAFSRHKKHFKTECGCDLVLASCHCIEHCKCELFVKTCACPWPISKVAEFAEWLAQLDPDSFADRPHPSTTPMFFLKRSARVALMGTRLESGFSIWHTNDRLADTLKNGATLSMSRNGEAQFGGVELPPVQCWCPICRFPSSRNPESRPYCSECSVARRNLAPASAPMCRKESA